MSQYYKNKEIQAVENPPLYDSTELDFNARQNLLLNKPIYSLSDLFPIGELYSNEQYNSTEASLLLTDGNINKNNIYTSDEWFHFTHGCERSLVFKFDKLCAVDGYRASFLRNDDVGIKLPRKLFVSVSENGIDWQTICSGSDFTVIDTVARCEKTIDFGCEYRALYIKFKFDVQTHVYCDEIAVFGTKHISNAAKHPVSDLPESNIRVMADKYPDYSQFLNVHNVLLSYNCIPKDHPAYGECGSITVDQYMPHVAYIDKQGNIKDTFFDAFLFLPYTAFNYSNNAKTANGWHEYVNNVFEPEHNLAALDIATANVKKSLSLKDYKVKVFFSILYTFTTSEKFGDLCGDGKILNFKKIEDRKTAIKWTVDEYIRRYNEGGYPNTQLGGFYWFEEFIAFADPHEMELLRFAREYIHSLNLKIFWIPYYQSSGFSDWQELGFDIACMQPNYAFNKDIPVSRLYDNAETTKKLGMCVEMESNGVKDPLDIEKFKQYMDCGAETGYMKSVKMYYQGGVPGEVYAAFKSDDANVRSVYDDLYLFAKEKYVSRGLIKYDNKK